MRTAAENSLARQDHPIARYFFTIEHGMVVRPALNSPPRQPVLSEFLEAEYQELSPSAATKLRSHNSPRSFCNRFERFARTRRRLADTQRCSSPLPAQLRRPRSGSGR